MSEDDLKTPVQTISSLWPENGSTTFEIQDAEITVSYENNSNYRSNKNLNFKIKINKFPNESFELKVTTVFINKDSSKNFEKISTVKFAKKQSVGYFSIDFPVNEIDDEHGWLTDGKFNLDTSLCIEESSVNTDDDSSDSSSDEDNKSNSKHPNTSDDESDSDDNESFEACWLINNYSQKPGIYKSQSYNINCNKIHFEAIRNKSESAKTTPFSIDVLVDEITDKYKIKISVTLMNQNQDQNRKSEKNAELSQSGDRVVVTFPGLMQSELTPENGFIKNNQMMVIVHLSEQDGNKADRVKLSSNMGNGYYQNNYNYTYNYSPNYTYSYKDMSKENTGYVGLQNQGATCYMNSMLQSLYHTPAFRKLIYEIPTVVDENESTNVILNLQRLFGMLQFSDKSCSTKALTKSFGWDSHRTYIQHDTQEFLRVLIDNIENKIKDDEKLKDGISNILRGQARKYIRCKDVNYESSHTEYFYDLSMVVKDCPTLEDSFKKYVETEELSGNDKYDTGDPTFGKQDALMGLEFLSFPPVLHLQLRRFEYDFDYDRNVKINDRFEFPKEINLEPFLAKEVDRSKSYIYDLYGVLVHSGGVSYGHYYAFLRTSTDPQWYEFNDSTVSKVDEKKAIEDNFGGQQVKSFSAYFLIYVRRDDAKNIFESISESIIPQHIRDYIENPEKYVKTTSSTPKVETKTETKAESSNETNTNENQVEIDKKDDKNNKSQNIDEIDVFGIKVKTLPHLQIEAETTATSISNDYPLILFDYDDFNVPLSVINVNSNTNLTDLIQLIYKSRNLNYDPEKDSFLLYGKDYFNDLPSTTPLSLKIHSTFLTVANTYKADSLYFIYYRYIPNITPSDMENKLLLSIRLSLDGSTITKKAVVIVTKACKGFDVIDAAFQKIDLDELKVDKNSLLSDNENLKYKNIRLMPIKNSKIVKLLSLKATIAAFYTEYRIDIIPEDQRNLSDDEIVVLLSTAQVSDNSQALVYGTPFFMKLKKEETIEQLKLTLKDKLEIDEKEFPKLKLFQAGEYLKLIPKNELKNDKVLGNLDLKAGIFVVKNMHRVGNSSRKKEEVLKIDN